MYQPKSNGDALVAEIAAATNLQVLRLDGLVLTPESISHLKRLSKLEFLLLPHNAADWPEKEFQSLRDALSECEIEVDVEESFEAMEEKASDNS